MSSVIELPIYRKYMNILVVYAPQKASESLGYYFLNEVGQTLREKRMGEVYTMPIVLAEEVRYNMDKMRQIIEQKHIDLVVAAGFNAFLALSLPAEIKKLVICPVIDPLVDTALRLSTRCVFEDEDYKYMRQLRRDVNGYITLERKRNTFAIFIPCYDHENQHELFERKYGHKNIKNWVDYTGKPSKKPYKIGADGRLTPNRDEVGINKRDDFWNAVDDNLKTVFASFFPECRLDNK